MTLRPVTEADLPAVTELYRAADTAWFGEPEYDAAEVAEQFANAAGSLVALQDGRPVAVANWTANGSNLVVDPEADPAADGAPVAALLDALPGAGVAEVEVLDRNHRLRDALAARGWVHHHSSFELFADVPDSPWPAEPVWPAALEIRGLGPDDALALHTLIYRDAGWAEIPGHPERTFDEWQAIFLTENEHPAQQVLALDAGQLVGAAIGRTWSDGTGWVSQLAVARTHRGRGLGRALLLAALRLRVENGARRVGLSVEAANRSALALYLDVGLAVDREWMTYRCNGDAV